MLSFFGSVMAGSTGWPFSSLPDLIAECRESGDYILSTCLDQFCWDIVDFSGLPFFNDCTEASTSLRRMGWSSSVSARGQSSTTDPHRPCDHTAKRSTLPTGPAPPPIETEKNPTYKSIMAYTSAIYQHAAHTTDQLSSPSWYTGAIPSSLSLDEKHWRIFRRKNVQYRPAGRKKRKINVEKQRNKRGDRKVESNDSPDIPDSGKTL